MFNFDEEIYMLTFSTRLADWNGWEEKLLRKALTEGFYGALTGTIGVHMASEVLDLSTLEGIEMKNARGQNKYAFMN